MNGLLITHDFLPAFPGGISTYYHELCRRLDGDLAVLAPAAEGDAEFDALQRFPIYRRPLPAAAIELGSDGGAGLRTWVRAARTAAVRWVAYYRAGRRIVEERGIDTVLIGHLQLAPIGPALRRATGARYGVVLHGGELHRYIGRWPVRRLVRRALSSADLRIANSDFTRRQYLDLGVRDDARWLRLHPGVDTALFRPGAGDPDGVRRRHGLADRPVIASVARLVPWKGQDTVLRALPAVLGRVPDAVYLIVGDGPYREELVTLANGLGLREHVVFAGFVSEKDLPSYYRAADVVAVPTREVAPGVPIEGFGIVYVEAGACGVPVIGGRGGGTDESIEEGVTGFLVDPEAADELADALVRLLTDRDLARRFGRAGRERAVALFDWERGVQRLREFLEGESVRRAAPAART